MALGALWLSTYEFLTSKAALWIKLRGSVKPSQVSTL